ncbi:hypothetical protein AM587_10006305 [Phytophthora nicotianae]|uniref:Uncharacterized protein n=1 Tax=Phytophthora nicotianae TaxID=4792 RepID=A0A0W8CG29_PHYNI|nr:hypothetical protein AM587_10006305 [Phytophthora nicotianae]
MEAATLGGLGIEETFEAHKPVDVYVAEWAVVRWCVIEFYSAFILLMNLIFVGEDAVVTFAIESGLIRDGSGESEEEASGGDVVSMEGPVNASQIDTSVALSQNTISAMFGSDRDSEPAQLEQSDQGMNVGALQRLLSGAGSNNSDNGRGSDGGSVNDGGSVEDDVHVTIPIDDVNVMVDGELPDEYEAIDSSGSDSSDNSGDDIIERREYPDDEPAPDEEVARMDDAFVEGLGGTLTLDAIDKDALRRFEWSTPSSSFEAATGSTLVCLLTSPLPRASYRNWPTPL